MPRGWARLEREIRACRRCPLHATRSHVVVYRGSARPRVLFVGEAPGAEEDRAGVPFVGRAGRRLDAAVAALGLAPSEWGVLNLVKCRPPGNRFPPASAVACRPFLARQLELLQPEVIVTLGRYPLGAFDPGAPPITQSAGAARRAGDRWVFPLLHPAAPLHAPRLHARWAQDLEKLRRYLGGAGNP